MNRRQQVREVPSWPRFDDDDLPRVLIEHPDPAGQQVLADAFRRRGYATLTCGGPRGQGAGAVGCPLVDQGACPAVDGADVVVSSLQVGGGLEGRIVGRIVADPLAPPLLLEAPAWQVEQARLPGTVAALHFPFRSADAVVDRVDVLVATPI